MGRTTRRERIKACANYRRGGGGPLVCGDDWCPHRSLNTTAHFRTAINEYLAGHMDPQHVTILLQPVTSSTRHARSSTMQSAS